MSGEIVKYDPQESLTLQKVSEGLFSSGLFPNTKNKYGAFAIVQYGRELGIPPMMALRNINIISGQLACNAQLMLSLAIEKGVTTEVIEESDKGAKIKFKRGGREYVSSFTENDARAAGLLGKDNWKKYPRDMYYWRAVAKGIRRIAPDAVMGLYTAEEITEGAVVAVSEVKVDNKPTDTIEAEPVSPEPPVSTDAENTEYPEFDQPSILDTPKPATDGQIKQIQMIFQKRGFTKAALKATEEEVRELRLKDLSDFCQRGIKSSKDLTYDEATSFIKASLEAA